MQMFGVGPLELLVILILTVVVVGPDRLPGVAADLARWIRRTRAYAQHLTRDFSDVVKELEKEADVSREDWKEIASLVTRHTGELGKEIERAANTIEESGDLEAAKREPADEASNVVPFEAARSDGSSEEAASEAGSNGNGAKNGETQPWYVPERTTRRRLRE
jgi:sec-independent protein translocase protein TatB